MDEGVGGFEDVRVCRNGFRRPSTRIHTHTGRDSQQEMGTARTEIVFVVLYSYKPVNIVGNAVSIKGTFIYQQVCMIVCITTAID